MSRYPYTIACDFVREHCDDFNAELGIRVPSISRAEASQVMRAFEKVFGLTHEEMAKRIADYAQQQEATQYAQEQCITAASLAQMRD